MKCYTIYNSLIIIQHTGHMRKFFYRKHQMSHFLSPFLLLQCIHLLQNDGQAFEGKQLQHFHRDAVQIYGNTKTCNINTKKKKKKKKKSNQITFEKKKIYVNSTEMYGICVPPRIDTLSEQSMS